MQYGVCYPRFVYNKYRHCNKEQTPCHQKHIKTHWVNTSENQCTNMFGKHGNHAILGNQTNLLGIVGQIV